VINELSDWQFAVGLLLFWLVYKDVPKAAIIETLKELADKYKVTPSQIALNWVIHFHGDIVVAIPGATKADQAKDNADSMKFKLAQDELDYLDEVSSPFKN